MSRQTSDRSNFERAFWTFLLCTLVGPFIAAILAALYTPIAIWANIVPFAAGDHPPFDVGNLPDAGGIAQLMVQSALRTFIWAPIAAAITAVGLIILLLTRGEAGWALAGVAGVVGFFAAYIISPFGAGELLPVFAIAAGLVAAALSLFLVRINVLPQPS